MKTTPPANDPNALLRHALALHQSGDIAGAMPIYRQLLRHHPKNDSILYLLGTAEIQAGNPREGVRQLDRALALSPANPAAHYNRGTALIALQRFDDGLKSLDRAIRLKPDYAEAYYNRGNALLGLGRPEEAVASYEQAIRLQPGYTGACYNLANTLVTLGRTDDARERYEQLIALAPEFAEAFNNLGNVLKELGRPEEALARLDRAIALRPDYAEAHSNRGNVLHDLGRPEEALAQFGRAIALRPDYAEAYTNKGNALEALKRLDEALACHERALQLRPDYAEACSNRGNALKELHRFDEALASYGAALRFAPGFADAWANMGATLRELKRYDEAIGCYEHALRLRPDYAEAWFNQGNALREAKRFPEAIERYERALALKPDVDFLLGQYLHTKMALCDWERSRELTVRLLAAIREGKKASPPFQVLSLSDDEAVNQAAAIVWAADVCPPPGVPAPDGEAEAGDRIHVGYYSADFHGHAMMHLMAEFFECHDKGQFRLTAFSFGPDTDDAVRARLVAAFDAFIDVRGKSDGEVAALSRNLGVDIAVDLSGYTKGCRPGIFAQRAAPLQVNYLGYPGTLGAGFMDYLIADGTVIPEANRRCFSEKIIYLPDCYQVNDSRRMTSDRAFSRAELGLPETGFVFCCFNNNYKITPAVFDSWMRILDRVECSVLWLLEDNPLAADNLRREVERRGISPERLVFAKRMPFPDHLARHRAADLFLDTLPYNAHTTASDALLAGLPVLTRIGTTFAGRVAASLLGAIGLPELVTRTAEEYEALAVELATDPGRLDRIKQKLAAQRTTTALFDTPAITRHIEDAYRRIIERRRAGAPPDHLHL